MTLHQALQSGKKIKRASYDFYLKEVNGLLTPDKAMKNFKLTVEDMRAADWEVEEEEKETSLILGTVGTLTLQKEGVVVEIIVADYGTNVNFVAEEKDVDKLLTFLYNNTEIGKKRVIPF